jgi:hypothetical protein
MNLLTTDKEYAEVRPGFLRRFLKRILDGRVLLQAEDKTFCFVVENNVDRMERENQLKPMGAYRNNRRIVVVP